MNHPSIGGKEQEPQSTDAPAELLDVVANAHAQRELTEEFSPGFVVSESVRQEIELQALRDAATSLEAVPPGWMKTEQGWVQMEPSAEQWACAPGCGSAQAKDYGHMPDCQIATQFYSRVKQPSEDHPVGL